MISLKKAAIYARKSKFTEKGDSIDNQIKLCKNYLANLGVTEVIVYSDEGFSGKNIDRPEFKRLLDDAKSKKFDILICYKLDRISRNVSDFSNLITRLELLNISFISVIEQFDTSSAMGKAMMYITSVFSQLERETISQRIMDNMYALAEKGYWLGGEPPTGYSSKRVTVSDANGKSRTYSVLNPIPKEIELVKLIFSKYLSLGSLSQVEKYMLSNNIKTKRNKDWSKTSLRNILENPAYVKATKEVVDYFYTNGISTYGEADDLHGFLIYKKRKGKNGKLNAISDWIYAASSHEGIIEANDWLRVQELIKRNKGKIPATGCSNTALLGGLITCKQCGSFMRVAYGSSIPNSSKKKFYYMCTLKHNSGKTRCSCKNINGIELDEIIVEKLKELAIDKKILISELTKYNNTLQSSYQNTTLKAINEAINKNNLSIENLLVNIGLTTDEAMVKLIFNKIEDLKAENSKLNSKLDQLQEELESQREILKNHLIFSQRLKDFSTVIDTVEFVEKKKLISSIIERVFADGDTGAIQIKFKSIN